MGNTIHLWELIITQGKQTAKLVLLCKLLRNFFLVLFCFVLKAFQLLNKKKGVQKLFSQFIQHISLKAVLYKLLLIQTHMAVS